MDNFDTDLPSENEWEEGGGLAWNEFDWERYLREQEDVIHRYLGFYEAYGRRPDRIDRVAEQMGWETPESREKAESGAEESQVEEETAEFPEEEDVYTLHKNPVFVATRALYLGLRRPWELVGGGGAVPAPLALSYLASLHRGEDDAVQAIHALDFGDYSMAVSLLKRALRALNESLAIINGEPAERCKALRSYREEALPRLFDLREVWLRVISECRRELNRAVDEES